MIYFIIWIKFFKKLVLLITYMIRFFLLLLLCISFVLLIKSAGIPFALSATLLLTPSSFIRTERVCYLLFLIYKYVSESLIFRDISQCEGFNKILHPFRCLFQSRISIEYSVAFFKFTSQY